MMPGTPFDTTNVFDTTNLSLTSPRYISRLPQAKPALRLSISKLLRVGKGYTSASANRLLSAENPDRVDYCFRLSQVRMDQPSTPRNSRARTLASSSARVSLLLESLNDPAGTWYRIPLQRINGYYSWEPLLIFQKRNRVVRTFLPHGSDYVICCSAFSLAVLTALDMEVICREALSF
jgi:hypothetical protein